MSDFELERRKSLSFEQAEGTEPMPAQLQRTEMSKQLRAQLFAAFHMLVEEEYNNIGRNRIAVPWKNILKRKHLHYDHEMLDEFEDTHSVAINKLKKVLAVGPYDKVYGLVQWVLRDRDCPAAFREAISRALEQGYAPFRLVDGDTLMPIVSAAETKTILTALQDAEDSKMLGARTHLREALSALGGGNWAASINASVDAVEAVAKSLSGKDTLARALEVLAPRVGMHRALKNGLARIYDFTSDEQGLRHSLTSLAQANVDEADAILMLGVCSSFVSYLLRKASPLASRSSAP